jgi:hypothetical protein
MLILEGALKKLKDYADDIHFGLYGRLTHHSRNESFNSPEECPFLECILYSSILLSDNSFSHLLCLVPLWKSPLEHHHLFDIKINNVTVTNLRKKLLTIKLILHQCSL